MGPMPCPTNPQSPTLGRPRPNRFPHVCPSHKNPMRCLCSLFTCDQPDVTCQPSPSRTLAFPRQTALKGNVGAESICSHPNERSDRIRVRCAPRRRGGWWPDSVDSHVQNAFANPRGTAVSTHARRRVGVLENGGTCTQRRTGRRKMTSKYKFWHGSWGSSTPSSSQLAPMSSPVDVVSSSVEYPAH